MNTYRYPCTGNISLKGFGEYLEAEIGEPRRNLRLFVEELNHHLGSKYVTLTNSGSSANLVAALALAEKCRKAGKPLTAFASAFTFPTTVSSLLLAGFKITLIDVEPEGFNMDISILKSQHIPASVIAVTHFLGFFCDTKAIGEYAIANDSFVLQDACETFNTVDCFKDDVERISSDITTLSFYHPHHLSSYGGGAVICPKKEDYILCDSIAHWGRACKCHIDESLCHNPEGPSHQFTYERLGVNVEMSELNACFGRWQLQRWHHYERHRRANYQLLYDMLKDNTNLKLWKVEADAPSRFVFPIRLTNRMTVRDAWERLSVKGVEIRTLMGGATCTQPAFKDMVDFVDQSNAVEMADKTFFVGIHQTLSSDDVKAVARIINDELK